MSASIRTEFLALQELLAGRYSIERELGRGGMGIVLLARDVALDRPVAIKLLPPHLAARPDERDRFLQRRGPPPASRIPISCRFTSSRHTVISCSSLWA